MVARLACARHQIRVTIRQAPRPHRIPLRLRHQILRHVKRADRDRVGRGITEPIERIPHRE